MKHCLSNKIKTNYLLQPCVCSMKYVANLLEKKYMQPIRKGRNESLVLSKATNRKALLGLRVKIRTCSFLWESV